MSGLDLQTPADRDSGRVPRGLPEGALGLRTRQLRPDLPQGPSAHLMEDDARLGRRGEAQQVSFTGGAPTAEVILLHDGLARHAEPDIGPNL